jgi:hypothetical protein
MMGIHFYLFENVDSVVFSRRAIVSVRLSIEAHSVYFVHYSFYIYLYYQKCILEIYYYEEPVIHDDLYFYRSLSL